MSVRFYTYESAGYTIRPGGSSGSAGHAREVVEVLVLDRAYCHNVVASWSSRKAQGAAISRLAKIENVRAAAAERAELLNAGVAV